MGNKKRCAMWSTGGFGRSRGPCIGTEALQPTTFIRLRLRILLQDITSIDAGSNEKHPVEDEPWFTEQIPS